MNATHTHRNNTAITRLFSFTFALALVFTSLATTGCDTLDSNAVEDEPLNVMFSSHDGEPHQLGDHYDADGAASALDGTWELVSGIAAQADRITFATTAMQEAGSLFSGRFEGKTECSDFSGDFRADHAHLDADMLNVAAARCDVLVEEAVIVDLRKATGYKIDGDYLSIFAGEDAPALVFQSIKTDDGPVVLGPPEEDNGSPELLGPPEAEGGPEVLGPPEADGDGPEVLGPPTPAGDDPQPLGPPAPADGDAK